ncbi:hypothetical protein BD410DRAFT_824728 [Rickenella mellea]|uniref:F-box domain-containing protein n=1 Tax=Rickenella mellea TaxID=50990 RepID=A0A4Y7QJX6_9AGAM|nr:hypothetical protein BD410DRAFT_824728 [Rickenella mellea]
MHNLRSISKDVQSLVWSHLCARDLVSLMVACKELNASISDDKQLWVGCSARTLTTSGYHNYSIPYRRSMEDVDASDVRSWLAHGMSLHRGYSSSSPTIQKLDSMAPRIVTWVRLMRGRWCLVASANVSESRLTLWDLSSRSGRPHPCSEIFFPGPIMDGQIDDDLTAIRIALTVGCSDPYIQILSVGQLNGRAQFRILGRVPDASHSLLLHGSEVVVALMNDDDAFPVAIEWTTGKIAVLGPVPLTESASYHDLQPQYWNEVVVLVMTTEIQIYRRPDFASHGHSHCGSLISVHPIGLKYYGLPSTVDKAYFVNSETLPMPPSFTDPTPKAINTLLRILVRDRTSNLHVLNLTYSMKTDPKLSLAHFPCLLTEKGTLYTSVTQVCIGSTGGMILLRHSEAWAVTSRMSIANLRNVAPSEDNLLHKVEKPTITVQNKFISVEDLPNLQFWNSRGELFVGRFVDQNLLSTSSVLDDLPSMSDTSDIGQNQPVQMKLPLFYSYVNLVRQGRVPLPLIKATTKLWGLVDGRPFSAPGWSSDWPQFRNIGRWIIPHLRWGAADPEFHFGGGGSFFDGYEAASAVVRYDHGILGNIYPIAYREDNHTDVVFRVGQGYYLQTECKDEDDHYELVITVFATTHSLLKSHDSLQPNEYGYYATVRRLATYYSSPDSATLVQGIQIRAYDDILHGSLFPTELESGQNTATCSVVDGCIVIRK